jgi:phosphoenolpyruvate carboxylase
VADLRWQVATFGFHLAGLEVRQHAAVHRAALAALAAGRGADTAVGEAVTLGEVVATFRAMGRIQARYGDDACRRYVISFTAGVEDVEAVLHLARSAGDPATLRRPFLADFPVAPRLDVVPSSRPRPPSTAPKVVAGSARTIGPTWRAGTTPRK